MFQGSSTRGIGGNRSSDDLDAIGMAQTNHDLTQQPTSPTNGGSNLAGEAGMAHRDHGLPPSSHLPDAWSRLDVVWAGFEAEHEVKYWLYVQQRHQSSAITFLKHHAVVSAASLIVDLWRGHFLKAFFYTLYIAGPIVVCLMLHHKRRLDQLGWGMLGLAVGRTLTYSMSIFGLPDYFSDAMHLLLILFESLLYPQFEPVPIRVYASVYNVLWWALLWRHHSVSSLTLHPLLLAAGFCVGLTVRIRADVHDRHAYIRQANA